MPTPSEIKPSLVKRAGQMLGLILGPWPIRPFVFAVFVFGVVSFQQTSGNFDDAVSGAPRFIWLEQAPLALAFTFAVIAPTWLMELLLRRVFRSPRSRWTYLLSLAAASVIAASGAITVFSDPQWTPGTVWTIFTLAVRIWLMQIIIFAVFGSSQEQLSKQIDRANAAATELADQKEIVMRTEEQSRRAVADFLHDRVQSILVTSTMQLRAIAERTDNQSAAELRSVAEHLDELRSIDVREANSRLSPNIAVVGLGICIEQLISSLDSTVECTVDIDSALRDWAARGPDVDIAPLGLFRVIEQSASNSVVHGRARRINVVISADTGWITTTVSDDGQGLPSSANPGTGTAVIDSWTQILRGSWIRRDRTEGGVEVVVNIPVESRMTRYG